MGAAIRQSLYWLGWRYDQGVIKAAPGPDLYNKLKLEFINEFLYLHNLTCFLKCFPKGFFYFRYVSLSFRRKLTWLYNICPWRMSFSTREIALVKSVLYIWSLPTVSQLNMLPLCKPHRQVKTLVVLTHSFPQEALEGFISARQLPNDYFPRNPGFLRATSRGFASTKLFLILFWVFSLS